MTILSTSEKKWVAKAIAQEDEGSLNSSVSEGGGGDDDGDADKKRSVGFSGDMFKKYVEMFHNMRNGGDLRIYLTWCLAAEEEASKRLEAKQQEKYAKARKQYLKRMQMMRLKGTENWCWVFLKLLLKKLLQEACGGSMDGVAWNTYSAMLTF